VQARYQAVANLVFTANFNILENRNPTPGIDYNFLSRQNTVGAIWTPGRRLNVLAEYSRATVRSEIDFIAPQSFDRELSFYRDNAHIGSAMLNLAIPARPGFEPRLTFGGSFFASSGSRPTSYYQPLGRLALPVGRGVFWSSEWRWYALSQNFYVFEGFRNHQFTTGLRLRM
jgi:hypothetical protein